MASLSTDNGGLRRIQFKAADGKRKALRLGRIPLSRARTILTHVCHLEACLVDGSPTPPQTAAWLATTIGDTLRGRLAELGLAAPKVEAAPLPSLTVGKVIAAFKNRAQWSGYKATTRRVKCRGFRLLETHFGPGRLVDSITPADAADFYGWLKLSERDGGAGLAPATANTMATVAHTLFNFAIAAELLERSPFKAVPRAARSGNNSHVTLTDSLAILEALDGSEQRLLFGLARWGGLRIPSEPQKLRWCDVDRARERFLVHAPKTERYEGHEKRWVPIFPELRPLFQDRYDDAEEGDTFVLPSIAHGNESVATNWLRRAFTRSGVDPWARMFHSLRATRETELSEQFPMHTVCAWLGNSQAVASKHYLMVLESHFAQAAQNPAQHPTIPTGMTDKEGSKADNETAGNGR